MLASYWHSAAVRSILLDNSCKWPSCQMSETGYWIEGGKRLRLRPSNITFLPHKLLPPRRRASKRTFCSADATAAEQEPISWPRLPSPPPFPASIYLCGRGQRPQMRRSFWAIFAICRARRQSALERGKKEREKLAISSSLLVRCRSGEKRGRCRREQIACECK